MLKFQAQVYRVNDILGWYQRHELRLAPEFQRRQVWTPRGRSYLIDSVMKGMPLPQFFIREIVLTKERRTVREVVDGQQRLAAILDFLEGKLTVLPMHSVEYARMKFDDMPEDVQKAILSFPLSVNILEGVEDADILEIFSRLNSYSMPLNRQEKLNAKYVGAFKKCMAEMAKLHLAFWQRHEIFSKQPIARMRDVEFTCELVAAMMLGLQNQKSVIDSLYKKYDDEFPQYTYINTRFAEMLQLCERLLGGDIAGTEFKRASLFYSLFVAAYETTYGLKAGDEATMRTEQLDAFTEAQEKLIDLSEAVSGEARPAEYATFYDATRQSTDKIQQRQIRHDTLVAILRPCFR
jgi:hypothetical protein